MFTPWGPLMPCFFVELKHCQCDVDCYIDVIFKPVSDVALYSCLSQLKWMGQFTEMWRAYLNKVVRVRYFYFYFFYLQSYKNVQIEYFIHNRVSVTKNWDLSRYQTVALETFTVIKAADDRGFWFKFIEGFKENEVSNLVWKLERYSLFVNNKFCPLTLYYVIKVPHIMWCHMSATILFLNSNTILYG